MNIFIRTLFIICFAFQFGSASSTTFIEEGITCPDSIVVNAIEQAPAYSTFQAFLEAGGSHTISSPVDSTFKLNSETSDGNFCPGHRYREYSIKDEQGIIYSCTQVIKVTGYEVDLSINFVVNGLTVVATSTASEGTIGYEWDFGDGTFSNEANAVHTYSSEGVYKICCSATTICDFENICQNVNVGIEAFSMKDISTYYYCGDEINTNYTFNQYLEFGGSTTNTPDTASFQFINSGDTTFVTTDKGCTQQVPLLYSMKDTYGQIDTATITLNLIDTIGIQGIDLQNTLTCDADTLPIINSITEYINAGGSYTVHCNTSVQPTIEMLSQKVISENCPKKIERTYQLNACSIDTITHTIEYVDTLAPTINIEDITVQYKENVPVLPATLADFTDQGGTANDNCQLNADSFKVEEETDGSVPLIYTRKYTIQDICGNTRTIEQTITVTDPTNTDETAFNTNFSIFPNPGRSTLNIENQAGEAFELSIMGIDGKTIFSKKSSKSILRVPTENWNVGMYIIQIESAKQKTLIKWVKK